MIAYLRSAQDLTGLLLGYLAETNRKLGIFNVAADSKSTSSFRNLLQLLLNFPLSSLFLTHHVPETLQTLLQFLDLIFSFVYYIFKRNIFVFKCGYVRIRFTEKKVPNLRYFKKKTRQIGKD